MIGNVLQLQWSYLLLGLVCLALFVREGVLPLMLKVGNYFGTRLLRSLIIDGMSTLVPDTCGLCDSSGCRGDVQWGDKSFAHHMSHMSKTFNLVYFYHNINLIN